MNDLNHQTKAIIDATKDAINDEGVFSPDQINLLHDLIDGFATALRKEISCSGLHHH